MLEEDGQLSKITKNVVQFHPMKIYFFIRHSKYYFFQITWKKYNFHTYLGIFCKLTLKSVWFFPICATIVLVPVQCY